MLERWPQVCRVKITFTLLPTNCFVSTTINLIKCLVNKIPLRIRVRSRNTQPHLNMYKYVYTYIHIYKNLYHDIYVCTYIHSYEQTFIALFCFCFLSFAHVYTHTLAHMHTQAKLDDMVPASGDVRLSASHSKVMFIDHSLAF